MIKIVKGTYGAIINGQVRPKNANSPAFSLNEKEEARLVKLGVAVYVGQDKDEAAEVKAPVEDKQKPEEKPAETTETTTDYTKLSMKELSQIAKELNINSFGLKKSALIEKIKEATATGEEDAAEEDEIVDDDTPAPTFNETGAVQ